MSTIYIVSAFGGSYDDAWENNLCARRTMAEAEAEVERLKIQQARVVGFDSQVRNAYLAAREEAQPVMLEIPPAPKGPASTTKENMNAWKKQKKEWEQLAQPMIAENRQKQAAQEAAAARWAKAFAISLGATEEELQELGFSSMDGTEAYYSYRFDKDTGYDIEELELL
jgi:hypothetical protein